MLEARILRGRFRARWVNQQHKLACRSRTAHNSAGSGYVWILRSEKRARSCRCRSSRNDERVRGKAVPLIRLEHAVAERIRLRQLKIGNHLGRIDILELRI